MGYRLIETLLKDLPLEADKERRYVWGNDLSGASQGAGGVRWVSVFDEAAGGAGVELLRLSVV
jgi:hypothetical protein